MHSLTTSSIVIFFKLLVIVNSDAVSDTCNLPSGGPGICVKTSKCQPLVNLYKKKHKTYVEKLYIKQSVCFSNSTRMLLDNYRSDYSIYVPDLEGYRSLSLHLPGMRIRIKTKVCCPPIDAWANFVPKPVIPVAPNLGEDNDKPSGEVPDPGKKLPKSQPQDKIKNENRNKDDVTICGFDSTISNKIIGGNVTAVDQYPWVVLLEYAGGLLSCGGSLITSRFVLTAAHCVYSKNGSPLFARLGEYNISSFPTDLVRVASGGYEAVNVTIISVESSYAHPDFSRATYAHDIGILKLTKNAAFNDFIKIICIPTTDYVSQFTSNTRFTVAGWGEDNEGGGSNDVKKAVLVPYVPMETCKWLHKRPILDEYQICAGGEEGKDTCNGDSGGPLMYESDQLYFAVGIVSVGPKDCGIKGQPAVYTNVYKYITWIRDVLKGRSHRHHKKHNSL